jgi:hypothetical protein
MYCARVQIARKRFEALDILAAASVSFEKKGSSRPGQQQRMHQAPVGGTLTDLLLEPDFDEGEVVLLRHGRNLPQCASPHRGGLPCQECRCMACYGYRQTRKKCAAAPDCRI